MWRDFRDLKLHGWNLDAGDRNTGREFDIQILFFFFYLKYLQTQKPFDLNKKSLNRLQEAKESCRHFIVLSLNKINIYIKDRDTGIKMT